jgi:hypothetical protein
MPRPKSDFCCKTCQVTNPSLFADKYKSKCHACILITKKEQYNKKRKHPTREELEDFKIQMAVVMKENEKIKKSNEFSAYRFHLFSAAYAKLVAINPELAI